MNRNPKQAVYTGIAILAAALVGLASSSPLAQAAVN